MNANPLTRPRRVEFEFAETREENGTYIYWQQYAEALEKYLDSLHAQVPAEEWIKKFLFDYAYELGHCDPGPMRGEFTGKTARTLRTRFEQVASLAEEHRTTLQKLLTEVQPRLVEIEKKHAEQAQALEDVAKQLYLSGQMLAAIKMIATLKNISLKEAREYCIQNYETHVYQPE